MSNAILNDVVTPVMDFHAAKIFVIRYRMKNQSRICLRCVYEVNYGSAIKAFDRFMALEFGEYTVVSYRVILERDFCSRLHIDLLKNMSHADKIRFFRDRHQRQIFEMGAPDKFVDDYCTKNNLF